MSREQIRRDLEKHFEARLNDLMRDHVDSCDRIDVEFNQMLGCMAQAFLVRFVRIMRYNSRVPDKCVLKLVRQALQAQRRDQRRK